MNKHLIVIGTAVLLLVVGLSGCDESNFVSSEVEVVNYTVVTKWNVYTGGSGTYTYYKSGFYHDYPENAQTSYIINVTLKNNAGRLLPTVYIYLNFYDKDNNLLARMNNLGIISNLPDTYTETLSIQISKFQFVHYGIKEEYFDLVESVKFEISLELTP
jgi:hypothetical protein